ncbi:MAG: DUF3189 family protein [Bacillota bacterium]
MKIIYHCFGGAHASAAAASIHLGYLPADRIPGREELLSAPLYDGPDSATHGILHFVGKDRAGHEIFILGRKQQTKMLEILLRSIVGVLGHDPAEWKFVNCYQSFNLLMMIGGYSSRALKIVVFGRPLVMWGTMLAYRRIVKIVQKTKNEIS